MRHVHLTTADGAVLDADEDDGSEPAAVICHPDPRLGGDRHNAVVDAVFRSLAGRRRIRFDFRERFREPADLVGDVAAAIAHLAPQRPVHLIGYSLGASVAIEVARSAHSAPVASLTLIAPPSLPVEPPAAPALVLVPAHDRFCAPAAARAAMMAWPEPEPEVLAMADHSLRGVTAEVGDRVQRWLARVDGEARSAPDHDPG